MNNTANSGNIVGRLPSAGALTTHPNAASGDAAYNKPRAAVVGRVPPRGGSLSCSPNAGSGDPAYNEPSPRRLRRLHRVWPDRDGNISYLLTMCVDSRARPRQ